MDKKMELQAEVLQNYMTSFNDQVNEYKDNIESTRASMMKNIQAEMNKLGELMTKDAATDAEAIKGKETTTLNITEDEFRVAIDIINQQLLNLSKTVQKLVGAYAKG